MSTFVDIIKQVEPTVNTNHILVPFETDDKRIKNRLFLIQPETIPIQVNRKIKLPPPPPRYNNSITNIIQCLRDDDDDDDYSSIDLYDEDEFSEYSGFPTTDDEDDFEEEHEEY